MRSLIMVAVFCGISVIVIAQPGDPGGGGNPGVPITGIELLLAGGATLGIRKLLNARKNNHNQ